MNRRGSWLFAWIVGLGSVSAVATAAPCPRADDLPFTVSVKDVGWEGPALQGFAVARTTDRRWLFLGGRTAGLHGQQGPGDTPPPSSNVSGLNDRIYVVDLAARQSTSRALADVLPADLAVSLTVTESEFVQVGDKLYVVGGYGWIPEKTSMMTYASLTVLDVNAAARAVIDGRRLDGAVRRSAPNESLRVTGGGLLPIGETFYLVFGQRFDGFYTPQSNGSYTYQVRPFRVEDTGNGTLTVTPLAAVGSPTTDPSFRRRDLNLVPTILDDGRRGLTAYGGVFTTSRGPWMVPVEIDEDALTGLPKVKLDATLFRQQLSQYDCGVVPLWQGSTRTSFTLFFGGISQTFHDGERFLTDPKLPFVDHVGCVSRGADGASRESLVCGAGGGMPLRLSGLLGASARFIPDANLEAAGGFVGGVLRLDTIKAETVVGYVYGGILATLPNGGPSKASGRILEIRVSPNRSTTLPVPAVIPNAASLPSGQISR